MSLYNVIPICDGYIVLNILRNCFSNAFYSFFFNSIFWAYIFYTFSQYCICFFFAKIFGNHKKHQSNEYCTENAMKNSLYWITNKRKEGSFYVYVCGSKKRHGGYCKKKIAQHLDKIHCRGHQKNITMIFY